MQFYIHLSFSPKLLLLLPHSLRLRTAIININGSTTHSYGNSRVGKLLLHLLDASITLKKNVCNTPTFRRINMVLDVLQKNVISERRVFTPLASAEIRIFFMLYTPSCLRKEQSVGIWAPRVHWFRRNSNQILYKCISFFLCWYFFNMHINRLQLRFKWARKIPRELYAENDSKALSWNFKTVTLQSHSTVCCRGNWAHIEQTRMCKQLAHQSWASSFPSMLSIDVIWIQEKFSAPQ